MQTKLKDVAPNDVLRCTGWPTLSLRCSQPIVNSHFMHSPRLCDKNGLINYVIRERDCLDSRYETITHNSRLIFKDSCYLLRQIGSGFQH